MASLKRLLKRRGAPTHAEWVIVGLGNAGGNYSATRHNLGFQVVNLLATRVKVKPVRIGSTMSAASATICGQAVALVKPLTMMNASGKAVAQALRSTGCPVERTIVVYDDLDMRTGALRVRYGGGAGGNNGLKSIIGAVGPEFARVKIGIGRPNGADGKPTWDPGYVSDWVLSEPGAEEREVLHQAVADAADAVEAILEDGLDLAIARFNRR